MTAGNQATCSDITTVTDDENPQITCPADISVQEQVVPELLLLILHQLEQIIVQELPPLKQLDCQVVQLSH